MSDAPLILAVPSKGRLQENASAFFRRAGLPFAQAGGARDYRGAIAGLANVEVAFLSAAEIAQKLASGSVHLGVTGEDLIRESVTDAEEAITLLTPLGFGEANVVVAVPRAWIDVRTMSDLDEIAAEFRARHGRPMRVATKYLELTRHFFAAHGITDYRIVESLGATEAAPASGSAEIIVDITTTGATLAANALKIVENGVILRSQANLVASLRAPWSPGAREAARIVLARIAAEEEARTTREIRVAVAEDAVIDLPALAADHGAQLPFGDGTGAERVLRAPEGAVFALVEALLSAGARDVTVRRVDYLFRSANPLSEALFARIG